MVALETSALVPNAILSALNSIAEWLYESVVAKIFKNPRRYESTSKIS